MGILISCFKKKNEEYPPLLIMEHHCFVCNKVFSDNIKYNRHIPGCRMKLINNK